MITKIKYKDDTIEIHTENTAGKRIVETVFKCTEMPHPDLTAIFTKLIPVALEILQVFDNVWIGRMSINSVSFSYSEETDVQGAVITGKVELNTSNSPFCFNTPHLPFAQYSPTGEIPLMPQKGIDLLKQLQEEAELYMSGEKRAQGELFANTNPKK